jgi:hypothetical protein
MTVPVTAHRLLAPERWLAGLVEQRHAQRRTPAVLRTELRFGAVGVRLLAAALTDVLIGQFLVLAGLALVAASSASVAVVIGAAAAGLGAGVILASVIRLRHGLAAGRAFRGGLTSGADPARPS